jgi:hypothetical protein
MSTILRQAIMRTLLRLACRCAKPGTPTRKALDVTLLRVAGGGGGPVEPY